MTDIVYIESDFYVKNIQTLTQYVLYLTGKLDDNKLITIIGEYHNNDFPCLPSEKKSIYIDEYVSYSRDCKTKIILEISGPSPEKFSSDNITRLLKLINSGLPNIEVDYIDYRYIYLEEEAHRYLHSNHESLEKVSSAYITDKYIKPFFEKTGDLINLDKTRHLYSDNIDKLYATYLPSIDKSFRLLISDIEKNWDSSDSEMVTFMNLYNTEQRGTKKQAIMYEIVKLWTKVSDFYVIRELFKKNDIKHYVILIGQYHTENIINYLDTQFLTENNWLLTKIPHKTYPFIPRGVCVRTLYTAFAGFSKNRYRDKRNDPSIVKVKNIKKL